MSVYRFFCAICGAALSTPEGSRKRTMECTSCLHVVPVPIPVDMGADLGETMRVFPKGVIALEVKFLCPSCGTKLKIDARWEGRDVACPTCRSVTAVPRWSSHPRPAASLSSEEVNFLIHPDEIGAQPVAT